MQAGIQSGQEALHVIHRAAPAQADTQRRLGQLAGYAHRLHHVADLPVTTCAGAAQANPPRAGSSGLPIRAGSVRYGCTAANASGLSGDVAAWSR